MSKLLTDRKQAWADQRKPKQLRGKPLNPNAAIEARYYAAMRQLILQMSNDVLRKVEKLYTSESAQEYFGEDASVASQSKIVMAALRSKFDEIFAMGSKPMAVAMVGAESKASASSLQSSLKHLSGGLSLKTNVISGDIKEILTASVNENIALIKSIPEQYFTQIEGAVMRSITTGNGLQDLVPFIKKHEGVTLRRARIIARDQTRKAYSNLNFARMDKIGVKEYEWLHSAGGQKPRRLHQRMSGNIYRIDEPPIIDEKTGQRGKPGDLINCRCRAIPVIKFDEA